MIQIQASSYRVAYFMTYGKVKGLMWGGGIGEYPTRNLSNRFIKRSDLYSFIKRHLNNGTLDGGFGFQRLISAKVVICRQEVYVIDGKEFIYNRDHAVTFKSKHNETERSTD